MNELQTLHRGELILAPAVEKVRSALELWLAGFSSENTWRAYRKEVEAFAAFAGRDDVAEAVAHFLASPMGRLTPSPTRFAFQRCVLRLSELALFGAQTLRCPQLSLRA